MIHRTLVLRLGVSWLMFAAWIVVLFWSHSSVTASPFLILYFIFRLGTNRYRHGEPRFVRFGFFTFAAIFLALLIYGPPDFQAKTFHPASVIGMTSLVVLAFGALLGIYRDYLIVTGRVTLEPPSSSTNHDA